MCEPCKFLLAEGGKNDIRYVTALARTEVNKAKSSLYMEPEPIEEEKSGGGTYLVDTDKNVYHACEHLESAYQLISIILELLKEKGVK